METTTKKAAQEAVLLCNKNLRVSSFPSKDKA